MRKSLLISGILLIALVSCKTETNNPKDILNSEEITMIIEHYGCLGGGTQTINIREENGIRILTNSYKNGLIAPEKSVPFSSEKEEILADLIAAGNSPPDDDAYCTGLSVYNITTENYKCNFEDQTCKLHDQLAELVK